MFRFSLLFWSSNKVFTSSFCSPSCVATEGRFLLPVLRSNRRKVPSSLPSVPPFPSLPFPSLPFPSRRERERERERERVPSSLRDGKGKGKGSFGGKGKGKGKGFLLPFGTERERVPSEGKGKGREEGTFGSFGCYAGRTDGRREGSNSGSNLLGRKEELLLL
jgi:hypothetical protein